MERLKSGIEGLDTITNGGLTRNQLVLLTGTTGTGKTTSCLQFIYNGAKYFNENGVFLSFEDPEEMLLENAANFGWNLRALEKEGKFSFIKYDPYKIEDVLSILESTVREVGAKRVVIDSISALGLYIRDKAELRRMIFDISLSLRRLKTTPILVSEIVQGTPGLSRYGVEEFVADSVIVMYYEKVRAAFTRAIQVWKLRGSSHSEKLHPYVIGKNGVKISTGKTSPILTTT